MRILTPTHRAMAQADGDPGGPGILEMVTRAFEAAYGRAPWAITPDTLIHEDLGIDPLAFALVVSIVEDVFHVTLPDDVALQMRSVGDLVAWVEQHQAAERITS